MGALDVLPLATAKRYLNISVDKTENDVELAEDFIPPAVERVERHLAGQAGVGHTLVDYDSTTGLQRLALKMVLEEYWRTQRTRIGRGSYGGAGLSGTAIEADSGPAGDAPLRVRLTDLLGEPFEGVGAVSMAPQGCFPEPEPWPDPIGVSRGSCWW